MKEKKNPSPAALGIMEIHCEFICANLSDKRFKCKEEEPDWFDVIYSRASSPRDQVPGCKLSSISRCIQ